MTHSPLPWRIDSFPSGINGADGSLIAEFVSLNDMTDAEFVVRAVNSHQHLVDALKEMRDVCAAAMRVLHGRGLDEAFIDAIYNLAITDGFGVRADAAIAAAEGK